MKQLIVTNHGLQQYAARTGRSQFSCVAELINSVRFSEVVPYERTFDYGFTITRRFPGDTYRIWHDPKIDENLLAIISGDGAIKTVLRKEMFSYKPEKKLHGGMGVYDYAKKRKYKKHYHHRRGCSRDAVC